MINFKKKNKKLKGIAVGIAVLIVFGIVISSFLDEVLNDDGIVITENEQTINVDLDTYPDVECNVTNDTFSCADLSEQSVVYNQPKLAESNDGFLIKLLGNLDNEVALEIVAVKYNLAGDTETFRNAFPIQIIQPTVVVEDFLIENVQIAFWIIVPDNSALDIEATADFYLDGNTVATKKIFGNSPSIQNNRLALNVGDVGVENFDFTFKDEDFGDGTSHTFEVKVKDINGDLIKNGLNRKVVWNNEISVYKLDLFVDQNKITKLDESGDVIEVFKADGAVVTCSTSNYKLMSYITQYRSTNYYYLDVPASKSLEISVYDQGGNLVDSVDEFTAINTNGGVSKKPLKPVVECKKIDGLQRGNTYTIKVNDEEFDVTFPTTAQQNYNIQYSKIIKDGTTPKIKYIVTCSSYRDPTHCSSGAVIHYTVRIPAFYDKATSNFGFNWSSLP